MKEKKKETSAKETPALTGPRQFPWSLTVWLSGSLWLKYFGMEKRGRSKGEERENCRQRRRKAIPCGYVDDITQWWEVSACDVQHIYSGISINLSPCNVYTGLWLFTLSGPPLTGGSLLRHQIVGIWHAGGFPWQPGLSVQSGQSFTDWEVVLRGAVLQRAWMLCHGAALLERPSHSEILLRMGTLMFPA